MIGLATQTLKNNISNNFVMVNNILPTCVKCGVSVTDLVEPEVKQEGTIKEGKYIDNIWICSDCLNKYN